MSGDKLFSTFAAKVGASPSSGEAPEPEGPEAFGAFGWLRGHNRAIMLELRFRNGNIIAFNYSWLERIDFDPSDGLTLTFVGQKVKITGRHLNRDVRPNLSLLNGLIGHKVPWIQEADRRTIQCATSQTTVIEELAMK